MAELTFLISEFESREFAKQCKRFRNYLKNSLDSGRFLAIIYTYFYILFNGSYTFYDLLISPEKLATEAGKMNLATMSAGSFEFVVVPDKKITLSPDELSGNFTMVGSSDYEYSPTAVMNDELEAEINTNIDYNKIYDKATKEYGMVYPNKGQIRTYNAEGEGYIRKYQDIP